MAGGIHAVGDVLTRTRDGQDLNALWNQYQELLANWNATRQPLIDLLTFSVGDQIVDDVAQGVEEDFEEATEFGQPKAIRPQMIIQQRAYDFKWYDVATRFTFQFLADATAQQVDMAQAQVLEADNRLIFKKVMKRLFNNANNTTVINNVAYNAKPLYNADGEFIPDYSGTSFNAATHTHYVTSGAATLDSGDVEALVGLLEEHGYKRSTGYQIVVLVNPASAPTIRLWRAGVTNNNAAVAQFDFVPPRGVNIILPATVQLFGDQPAQTFAGFDVVGAYGPYLIVQDSNIPAGYMFAFATQGSGTAANLVGVREHANTSLRGLVLKGGDRNNYPIINSTFVHGFGTGIRTRGAGAVMQVTASGSYTTPTIYQ
jgi:hypothetical protein